MPWSSDAPLQKHSSGVCVRSDMDSPDIQCGDEDEAAELRF
jgi:hypothetical protein